MRSTYKSQIYNKEFALRVIKAKLKNKNSFKFKNATYITDICMIYVLKDLSNKCYKLKIQ